MIRTRRQFLTTLGAASAAAPFILPSRIWAAQGNSNPNQKITLGFIGVGTQGNGLLQNFIRHPNTQVVAVCDVDKNRRAHWQKWVNEFYASANQKDYKGCDAYNEFEKVLERKDIDAVVIATPDHWHAYIVVQAAKAKKDIYCEKPLSLTIHEARAMVKAARKYDRVFQTGSMQRSMSEFHKACTLVRNGCIGKVKTIYIGIGSSSKPCDLPTEADEPGLDWNRWLGQAPMRGYNSILSPRGIHKHFPDWRNYREFSGGMMTDWGAHHYDIAQWALGMDESGPVEIIPPEDTKNDHGLRFVYANGVEMFHEGKDGFGVTIIGENGKINVDRGRFKATPENIGEIKLDTLSTKLYKSNNHVGDFLQCVRTRQRPICDVEVGARSVSVCHLANIAYWTRKKLKWDPAKERFVDDKEANKWLDREVRGPWKV